MTDKIDARLADPAEGATSLECKLILHFQESARAMVAGGISREPLAAAMLTVSLSEICNNFGPEITAGWLREIADGYDAERREND